MEKDTQKIKGLERRYFQGLVETRAEGDSRQIVGRGIVYNSLSENFAPWHEGGLYEIIERGAADGLLEDEDIMVLLNHEASLVLARNKKTARLEERADGVYYIFDAPDTTTGNDTLTNVRLGNIRKSSFAFIPKDVKMERMVEHGNLGKINIRRITKFERLYDMSPVTYPAYENTEVMARSIFAALDELDKTTKEKEKEQTRALLSDVKRRHEIFELSL